MVYFGAAPVTAYPLTEMSIVGLRVGMSLETATEHLGAPTKRLGAEGYKMVWCKEGEEIAASVHGGELTSLQGPSLQVRPGVTLQVGQPASRIELLLGKADRYDYFDRHYVDGSIELVVTSSPRSGKVEGLRFFEKSDAVRRLTLSIQEPFDDQDVKAVAEIARARLLHFGSEIKVYPDISGGQLHLKAPSDSELQSALPVLLAPGKRALMNRYFDPRIAVASEFDIGGLMGRNLLSSQYPHDTESSPVLWRGAYPVREQLVWEFDIREEVSLFARPLWEGKLSLRLDGVEVGRGVLKEGVVPDSRYSPEPVSEGYHRARYTLRLPKAKARVLAAILSASPYPRPLK